MCRKARRTSASIARASRGLPPRLTACCCMLQRAGRIASATPRARVPEREPLDRVARLIAGASFVVGVDTGLLHLAAALGVPLVAVFSATEPALTGPVGAGPIAVLGGMGAPPSVAEVLDAVRRIGMS